jgi:hypothetical protein
LKKEPYCIRRIAKQISFAKKHPSDYVVPYDNTLPLLKHSYSIDSSFILFYLFYFILLFFTIDANSSIEVAADIMNQNKVRHLLVMEDENKVLGIITSSNFIGYLKEKLNLDDVNARILQSLKEEDKK